MAIGAKVRAMFGPYERQISNLWRAMFVDLDAWTATVRDWAGKPAPRVLEVGCGEGYSTARLVSALPDRPVDAIDVGGHIGRLYDGPAGAVDFRIAFAEDLARERPGQYDLIVLADVLHHVPQASRRSLLEAIRTLLAPGGVLAFKDWHRNLAPVHFAVHASDRWLTGDRVAYLKRDEARDLLTSIFGPDSIAASASIAPWTNNYAYRVIRN